MSACEEDTDENDWSEFVPGYAVSRFGEVYSLHNNRSMAVHLNVGNRRVVNIQRQWHMVARLVARAFVPGESPERWSVNHVDGNRVNDRWDNLEWASISEQVAHARENDLHKRGELHPRAKIRDADAKHICALKASGASYQDISCATGVSIQNAIDIVAGRIWGSVTGVVRKRRQRRLASDQVNEIRNSNLPTRACADEFGVGMTTVYRLRTKIGDAVAAPPSASGETWRGIDGFDRYIVSNYGRVFSRTSGKLLQTSKANRGGYVHVALRDGSGKPRWHYVHRLVALAFLASQKSTTKDVVDHIDGNKVNNHVDNLRFISQMDNLQRAYREVDL